jgi:hypothetical protein
MHIPPDETELPKMEEIDLHPLDKVNLHSLDRTDIQTDLGPPKSKMKAKGTHNMINVYYEPLVVEAYINRTIEDIKASNMTLLVSGMWSGDLVPVDTDELTVSTDYPLRKEIRKIVCGRMNGNVRLVESDWQPSD